MFEDPHSPHERSVHKSHKSLHKNDRTYTETEKSLEYLIQAHFPCSVSITETTAVVKSNVGKLRPTNIGWKLARTVVTLENIRLVIK